MTDTRQKKTTCAPGEPSYIYLKGVLDHDGWETAPANRSQLENGFLYVAKKDNRSLLFSTDDLIDKIIKNTTNETFDPMNIRLIIVSTQEKMDSLRREATTLFYLSIDDLRAKYMELNPNKTRQSAPRATTKKADSPIATLDAKVIDNTPVGGDKTSHYKLRFSASQLPYLVPGQFLMINTRPEEKFDAYSPMSAGNLDITKTFDLGGKARSYLKRPFGIHRAFYPGFKDDYLKELCLTPQLATILHTALPDRFDIFYKVGKHGIGTSEMKALKKNQRIQIVGPLGKRFDIRGLRSAGYEEVHIIGGGVGMAPLIFMAQALRFLAYDVKAFIGLESIDILTYNDHHAQGSKDAHLYVDDLKAIGIKKRDIYISEDRPGVHDNIVPEENRYAGLISAQYERYLLEHRQGAKKTIAFSCGPDAMMRSIFEITKRDRIPLKVLMERRMACGIGVCFSCVCERTKDGTEAYSRVCVDGPIYDASEIIL